MLSRRFVLCTLILLPSLAGVAQSSPNLRHFGRNVLVAADETVHNVSCFLCSAEVQGHATGSVRVFAGHVFLNGPVAGNVLVFGGNLTLTSSANSAAMCSSSEVACIRTPLQDPPHTVFPPIIFLPLILLICAALAA